MLIKILSDHAIKVKETGLKNAVKKAGISQLLDSTPLLFLYFSLIPDQILVLKSNKIGYISSLPTIIQIDNISLLLTEKSA